MPAPVSVSRVIPASPEAIFALLADPDRHHDIDGSGTVTRSRGGSRTLALGDRFGMDMTWGVPYATSNTVTELEPGRRIAWRTFAPMPLRRLFTGRTWRYELEPVSGGTRVTETWDPSTEAVPGRYAIGVLSGHVRRSMTATLGRLEDVVTQGGAARG